MGVTAYTQKSMADLKALAQEREVKVKGTGKNGALRRIDFVDALVKADKKAERAAVAGVKHAGYERKQVKAEDMNGTGDPHTPVADITFPTATAGRTNVFDPATYLEGEVHEMTGWAEPLERIATALEAIAFPKDRGDLAAENEQLRTQLASAQAENRRLRTSVGEDTRDLP